MKHLSSTFWLPVDVVSLKSSAISFVVFSVFCAICGADESKSPVDADLDVPRDVNTDLDVPRKDPLRLIPVDPDYRKIEIFDDLPAELQKQFDEAYKEYKASEIELARQQSLLDPTYVYARQRTKVGRDREAKSNALRQEYHAFLELQSAKGADAAKDFSTWNVLFTELTGSRFYVDCDQDEDCQPFIGAFAKMLFTALAAHPNPPEIALWPWLKTQLGTDWASKSEEESRSLLIELSKKTIKDTADEFERLSNRLQVPIAVQDRIFNRTLASIEIGLFRSHVENRVPKELSAARSHMSMSRAKLTALWPNWELGTSERSSELKRRDRMSVLLEPPPAERVRMPWVIGGFVVLLGLFLLFRIRDFRGKFPA